MGKEALAIPSAHSLLAACGSTMVIVAMFLQVFALRRLLNWNGLSRLHHGPVFVDFLALAVLLASIRPGFI